MNELSLKASDFPTAEAFDALLRANFDKQQLAVHLDGGKFYTQGTREWDDSPDITQNPGFRIKNWTFDSQSGATLVWDHSKVEPTSAPIALVRTTEMSKDLARLNLHTPQEIWDGQPRGQTVRDLAFDLQFAQAVPRWRAAGQRLRITAVSLGGHQAAIERVHVTNYGAYKYENFPLYIQGSYGIYDRDAIAKLDPTTHIFDEGVTDSECSHITDCLADGYVELSDVGDQVTVNAIMGSVGERTPGEWAQTMRAFCYQSGNRVVASGSNAVQAHTIYQSLRALVEKNRSEGANVGYYGDFYSTKGVVIRSNEFLDCYHGVQLLLSPTGPGNTPEQFSHEDYVIGPNVVKSRGPNVLLDTLGPTTDRRYIRNISVDAGLSLKNNGATGVTRTGVDVKALESKGGCGPLRFFRR